MNTKTMLGATIIAVLATVTQVTAQTYSVHQCNFSPLVLSCASISPSDKTIYIQRADYGQYENGCDQTCCPPGAGDCTADVNQVFPQDMLDLRAECDNETDCSYIVQTATLVDCTGIQQSQYINVFFKCLPEDPTTESPTTPIPTTDSPTVVPSSTTTPQPTPGPPDDGSLSGGVIAGIVIGILILAACVGLAALIIYKMLKKPPPGKKGQRRPRPPGSANQKLRVHQSYDNNAYTTEDDVQITMVDDKQSKQNGNIPIHTPTPVSDGKRQSRPVAAAESIKYAKEKENQIRSNYRTVPKSSEKKNQTKEKKSRQKKSKKEGNQGQLYENVNSSRQSELSGDSKTDSGVNSGSVYVNVGDNSNNINNDSIQRSS